MASKDEVEDVQKVLKQHQQNMIDTHNEMMKEAEALGNTKQRVVKKLEQFKAGAIRFEKTEDVMYWEVYLTNLHRYNKEYAEAKKNYQEKIENQQQEADEEGVEGSGSGVVAGGAIAAAGMAAPTAAMALASTFGVASTGTAIASLSGAAATNAALALIGGGSMAAGTAALGLLGPIGLGVGGVVAILSLARNAEKRDEQIAKIRDAIRTIDVENKKMQNLKSKIKSLKFRLDSSLETVEHTREYSNREFFKEAAKLSTLLNVSF